MCVLLSVCNHALCKYRKLRLFKSIYNFKLSLQIIRKVENGSLIRISQLNQNLQIQG